MKPNGTVLAKKLEAGAFLSKYAGEEWKISATPALTASKVSNGRTRAPAGNTSILIRPPLASPIVSASRTALACSPGRPSGQSVTILSSSTPCARAGLGNPAPATVVSPTPVRTSRRLMPTLPPRTRRARGGQPFAQAERSNGHHRPVSLLQKAKFVVSSRHTRRDPGP